MVGNNPEDQFIDYAKNEEDGPIPTLDSASFSGPSVKFLQNSLNEFSKVMARQNNDEPDLLQVDGDFGLKTKTKAKDMLKNLPPEMKRWANARVKSSLSSKAPMELPPGMDENKAREILSNVDFENLNLPDGEY
jgi:hypothetical protein